MGLNLFPAVYWLCGLGKVLSESDPSSVRRNNKETNPIPEFSRMCTIITIAVASF